MFCIDKFEKYMLLLLLFQVSITMNGNDEEEAEGGVSDNIIKHSEILDWKAVKVRPIPIKLLPNFLNFFKLNFLLMLFDYMGICLCEIIVERYFTRCPTCTFTCMIIVADCSSRSVWRSTVTTWLVLGGKWALTRL